MFGKAKNRNRFRAPQDDPEAEASPSTAPCQILMMIPNVRCHVPDSQRRLLLFINAGGW